MTVVANTETAIAYRIPEAARQIGVSRSTMWAMIARKEFTPRKIGGATVILRRDLIAYVEGAPSAEQAKVAQASIR